MLLLTEKTKSHYGSGFNIKGGWVALQRCGECKEGFIANGEHKWHNTVCQRAIKKRQSKTLYRCEWCGMPRIGKAAKYTRYCSDGRCAQAGIAYVTPKKREQRIEEVYRLMITEGNWTAEGVATMMGISATSVWTLLDVRCGPDARQWIKDMRLQIDPRGFKGMGRKQMSKAYQMVTRGSDMRSLTAKALKVWRETGSTEKAGLACGRASNSGSGILLRSSRYRAISESRRARSQYMKREVERGWRSQSYVMESDMVKGFLPSLEAISSSVETEVMCGEWSKVDVLVVVMGRRFAIEAKASSKKSRVAGCIGQALVSSNEMGDCTPVVCLPDCQAMHGAVERACVRHGVLLTTPENIADVIWREVCVPCSQS